MTELALVSSPDPFCYTPLSPQALVEFPSNSAPWESTPHLFLISLPYSSLRLRRFGQNLKPFPETDRLPTFENVRNSLLLYLHVCLAYSEHPHHGARLTRRPFCGPEFSAFSYGGPPTFHLLFLISLFVFFEIYQGFSGYTAFTLPNSSFHLIVSSQPLSPFWLSPISPSI